jgi:hypothetical protein
MENKPSGPDRIFGRFAQVTARPSSRRSFISKIATAGIFLLTFGKSAYGQEGSCTPDPANYVCCCTKPGTSQGVSYSCGPTSPPIICCYGMVGGPFIIGDMTKQCCGDIAIPKTQACCLYACTWDPSFGYWTNCRGSKGYDNGDPYATPPRPATQGCCQGSSVGVYTLGTQGCCQDVKVFTLKGTCCCPDGTTEPCVRHDGNN